MGHFCKICKVERPNESFSGKGHRMHICKPCMKTPREKKELIYQEEEISSYLKQSHITKKNISRLKKLAFSHHPEIAEMASVVLEVAQVKPHKKRRLKVLARERKDLLQKLEETGLL